MNKRIIFISIILIFALQINVLPYHIVGLDNFSKEKEYDKNIFTDVPETAWYFENIKAVYEYGIMSGNGDNTFNPLGNITIAQAITLLSKIHSKYMHLSIDNTKVKEKDPWYTLYVQYANSNKLIDKKYSDYNVDCTRADFSKIIAMAIDPIDFEQINYVEDESIPDIDKKADYYDSVYMLYRAGIFVGSNSEYCFFPDANITRAEAATVVTRIIDKNLWKSVMLTGNN